jgi:hypothetical protein
MPQTANVWDDLPDYQPPPQNDGAPSSDVSMQNGRPTITVRPRSPYNKVYDDLPDYAPTKTPHDIGAGEAALHGGLDTATFGTFPTLVGIAQAGGADKRRNVSSKRLPPTSLQDRRPKVRSLIRAASHKPFTMFTAIIQIPRYARPMSVDSERRWKNSTRRKSSIPGPS